MTGSRCGERFEFASANNQPPTFAQCRLEAGHGKVHECRKPTGKGGIVKWRKQTDRGDGKRPRS